MDLFDKILDSLSHETPEFIVKLDLQNLLDQFIRKMRDNILSKIKKKERSLLMLVGLERVTEGYQLFITIYFSLLLLQTLFNYYNQKY